jgi:hypothetical protein
VVPAQVWLPLVPPLAYGGKGPKGSVQEGEVLLELTYKVRAVTGSLHAQPGCMPYCHAPLLHVDWDMLCAVACCPGAAVCIPDVWSIALNVSDFLCACCVVLCAAF